MNNSKNLNSLHYKILRIWHRLESDLYPQWCDVRFVSDYRGGCRCFFNTKSPLMVVMLFYTVYFGSGYGVIAM
ncbi:hypothetical protein CI102_7393 [Trichoderma harzianum]|nr:hypothetical protein CI102_7393 [Trichoderma harzianum]